ncbi:hypothetical protein IWW47_001775, partial [Coemansia sp. RSA 2052]
SELSADDYHASSGPESPAIQNTEIKRTVSFGPLAHDQPRQPHHHHLSRTGYHRHSLDTPGQSVDGHRKPADVPRLSAEGYLSSASNASSGWSSGKPHESGKPGAYRVGNEVHVSVDDKRDGTKRMNAMAMVSSMRRRVGVYKARTSAEMEQWVTAINQEIRRMSLNGEW